MHFSKMHVLIVAFNNQIIKLFVTIKLIHYLCATEILCNWIEPALTQFPYYARRAVITASKETRRDLPGSLETRKTFDLFEICSHMRTSYNECNVFDLVDAQASSRKCIFYEVCLINPACVLYYF